MPYKFQDKWTFVLATDFHFGSRQCDETLIKKFVDKYKGKEQTKVFLLGDEIDAVIRGDKRFTAKSMHPRYASEDNPIDKMIEDFVDLLSPLKEMIIAGCDSNHNFTYRGISGSDCHYRISKLLEFERLSYGGWVNILWEWHKHKGDSRSNRTRVTSFHLTHGKPTTAITKAGKMIAMERDAWFFNSDLIAYGHTHLLAPVPSNINFDPMPGKQDYKKKKQRIIACGSFLKSYSKDEHAPYSEIKRYPPVDMGWAVVEVEFESGEPYLTTYTKEY